MIKFDRVWRVLIGVKKGKSGGNRANSAELAETGRLDFRGVKPKKRGFRK